MFLRPLLLAVPVLAGAVGPGSTWASARPDVVAMLVGDRIMDLCRHEFSVGASRCSVSAPGTYVAFRDTGDVDVEATAAALLTFSRPAHVMSFRIEEGIIVAVHDLTAGTPWEGPGYLVGPPWIPPA